MAASRLGWGRAGKKRRATVVRTRSPVNASSRRNKTLENQIVENASDTIPRDNYNAIVSCYGEIGANQDYCRPCYSLRLAWDKAVTIKRFSCHKLAKDSLEKIFKDIFSYYGNSLERVREARMDLFGGCLNVRKMRGSTAWSRHSWGIAIDLDPDYNKLRWGRNRATMPEPVIDIFQKYGWKSLGRFFDRDFMHFQRTR